MSERDSRERIAADILIAAIQNQSENSQSVITAGDTEQAKQASENIAAAYKVIYQTVLDPHKDD